jgi:hypothetical protein
VPHSDRALFAAEEIGKAKPHQVRQMVQAIDRLEQEKKP